MKKPDKEELVNDIYKTIMDNPIEVVSGLMRYVKSLQDKNEELAKKVIYGMKHDVDAYARFHHIDKEDWR